MYVVLCNVLPGSGYRLRATSKIGEVSGHSSLLRGFGGALAQACRARIRDGRRRWSGERGHRGIEPSCLRLRRTTQHVRKPQEAISGTLAALRSIASSLIEFDASFEDARASRRLDKTYPMKRAGPEDYKQLAKRCAEIASECSAPTVAEALRALALDYLTRAARLRAANQLSRQGRHQRGRLKQPAD
jgi:hypothetical protein